MIKSVAFLAGSRVVFAFEGDKNMDLNIFDFKENKVVENVKCVNNGEKPQLLLPLSEIVMHDMIEKVTKKRNGHNF
jgi:hypothetical protein